MNTSTLLDAFGKVNEFSGELIVQILLDKQEDPGWEQYERWQRQAQKLRQRLARDLDRAAQHAELILAISKTVEVELIPNPSDRFEEGFNAGLREIARVLESAQSGK